MSVRSRICELKIDNGVGSSLDWTATATVQDTAAGSSVSITIVRTVTGTLIAGEDTLDLDIYIDNGSTLVRNFSLTAQAASQSVTLYFTNDGTSGGSARSGTLRMRLHAVNTTAALSANRYNVDSDLTNNTPPTGSTVTIHDQGWIRGTTTATTALPGSGQLAYGDTLTATTTLGAAPFDSRTVKVALSPTLAAVTSGASTTTTFTTNLGSVDNRFPAAATSETTATTFPNATLTAAPWTTATLTENTRTVDPRFTKVGLLQVNDNAWGTAPLTKDVALHQRLTSDLGFVAMRYRNANGAGVNGLSVSHSLQDSAALVSAITWSDTTAAEGGENGWTNTLQAWSSSLPGGAWKHTTTVTAPAGATGLESGYDTLTLLARNPNYQVVAGVSLATAVAESDHAHPGDSIVCSLIVLNVATDKSIAPDTGSPVVSLIRYNASSNVLEALDATGTSWATWNTGALPTIALTQNPNNANLYQVTLSTSGWGSTDIVAAQAQCLINGTPYGADAPREMVSAVANHHSGFSFDGAGFVGFPQR